MKMRTEHRALDKIYKRRDRYTIPEWQREEVWTRAKKQKLLDSILRGWQLPKFYFMKISEQPEAYEVVDGQQRLTAIFEFLDDELALSDRTAETYGGKFYSELPDVVSDSFDDFEIQFDVIENADEKDVKEFFQRLQEGLPLTSSEKLNAVDGKLRDFCVKLARHDFFKNTVYLSDKRYAYFDIVSKAATIEVEDLNVGLRYEDMRKVFESQSSFSPNSQVAKRMRAGLSLLESSFPAKCSLFRNRSIIQSFITLACRVAESAPGTKRLDDLVSFGTHFQSELSKQIELGHSATDPDYVAFQKTINANVRAGPRTRHRVLLRKLLKYRPELTDLFDSATLAESAIGQEISRQGEEIATLVAKINEAYSGKYGEDLFKPTNKTTNALQVIRKVADDYDKYRILIENLYFLFREGPGNRMNGRWPKSFVDVNDLRTAIGHDLDHGKKSKAAAKKKKLAETFKTYSGATSASVVSQDRFPPIQAKLLAAIAEDLRKLLQAHP